MLFQEEEEIDGHKIGQNEGLLSHIPDGWGVQIDTKKPILDTLNPAKISDDSMTMYVYEGIGKLDHTVITWKGYLMMLAKPVLLMSVAATKP